VPTRGGKKRAVLLVLERGRPMTMAELRRQTGLSTREIKHAIEQIRKSHSGYQCVPATHCIRPPIDMRDPDSNLS
jgi:hypothetical protein